MNKSQINRLENRLKDEARKLLGERTKQIPGFPKESERKEYALSHKTQFAEYMLTIKPNSYGNINGFIRSFHENANPKKIYNIVADRKKEAIEYHERMLAEIERIIDAAYFDKEFDLEAQFERLKNVK